MGGRELLPRKTGDSAMRILVSIWCVFLALGACWRVEAEAEIRDIRAALHNKQFEEAIKLIDLALVSSQEQQDFLKYLKALSLFYKEDFSGSIGVCDDVIREYESSPWYRKAIFLKISIASYIR